MDNLELASPIATLRSLGALEGDQEDIFSPYDPIARGVLTFQEAQDAFHVYFEIIALLDKTISRLLLSPTPNDASVDSIRALMLYLQWMPCAPKNSPDDSSVGPHSRRPKLKTRYNDMSAWAVFGLALRYASFLNLERLAFAPFQNPTKTAISRDDVDRMRTWLNLITYDCNLTLTSGLPISVNPLPAMKVVRDFCMHRTAQDPGDLRYGALIELACIIQRVKGSDGGTSNRQPTVPNLKKANVEMEEWERHWLQQLKHTPLQHIQLPFTSLRWYRLSLNSSILRPLLSSSTRSQTDIFQVWTLGFLETSITAASQILLSLVTNAHQFIWREDDRWYDNTGQPEFSEAYLFLDDLQILGIPTMDISTARAPSRPRPDSLLARLTRLSMDIFEAESDGPEFRSGGGYEAIIRDAASLVLDKGQDQPASIAQDPLDPAIQSLFDLMDDTVYEWPSIYENDGGAEPNFADVWGPRC
ncbi:hypothetical protein SCUP234_07035 [Seiridium cupressi]